jgi:hypothetical protein
MDVPIILFLQSFLLLGQSNRNGFFEAGDDFFRILCSKYSGPGDDDVTP